MDSIDRKQLDRIVVLLQNHINTDESIQLGRILNDADIIPKLYQQTYVESMYQRLKDVKTPYQLQQKIEISDSYLSHLIWKNESFDALQELLNKAHCRQDEICDFNDSPLPIHTTGRCNYENHYENNEDVELTEDEQEAFDKMYDIEGYHAAWGLFEDKINPDNQKLTLILNYSDDETKVSKDDGEYVCESCLEEIAENSDGGVSCDMEFAE